MGSELPFADLAGGAVFTRQQKGFSFVFSKGACVDAATAGMHGLKSSPELL